MSRGAVMLPQIFSDNMVLQTRLNYGQRPLIFGYADPSEVVTVNITIGQSATTLSGVANSTTGYFSITLPANNEVTNVTLRIAGSADPSNVTTIRGAAYGDVLLCGGQSNMVMSVIATFNGTQYSNITWPNIRLFNVIEAGATSPQQASFALHRDAANQNLTISCLCRTYQILQPTPRAPASGMTTPWTAILTSTSVSSGRLLSLVSPST